MLALSESAVQALRRHRLAQQEHRLQFGPVFEDHDLVFPSTTGTFLSPFNFHRDWKKITAEANVKMRFHDLRHASATMALDAGVNARVLSDRLGHADPSVTLNIYTHTVSGQDRDAAESIAAALRRTG